MILISWVLYLYCQLITHNYISPLPVFSSFLFLVYNLRDASIASLLPTFSLFAAYCLLPTAYFFTAYCLLFYCLVSLLSTHNYISLLPVFSSSLFLAYNLRDASLASLLPTFSLFAASCFAAYCLLTAYCLLPTAYCLLLTAYFFPAYCLLLYCLVSLLSTHNSQLITTFPLFPSSRLPFFLPIISETQALRLYYLPLASSLFTASLLTAYLLPTAYCLLLTAYCLLPTSSLLTAYCLLLYCLSLPSLYVPTDTFRSEVFHALP